MDEAPKVAIIILNYNGYIKTLNCINSLKKMVYPNYEIIVVDNNSTDNSEKYLSKIKDIHFIQTNYNLGYGGGNNVGIRYAQKIGSDYVLILNNDTEVQSNFLSKLILGISGLKNLGICSCKILDGNEKIWYGGGKIIKQFGTVKIYKSPKYKKITEMSFLTGCMLLINSEVFHNVGLFNEDYFMYFEDTQYCYRTLQKGFKLYYNPNVKIIHFVNPNPNKPFFTYYTLRNRLYFISENLDNKMIPKLYFYLASFLKIINYKFWNNDLYKTILNAITDYRSGIKGNTYNECN